MSDLRTKRLQKELKMIEKEDFVEEVSASEDDIGKWQIVLKSSSLPEYLGQVVLCFVFPQDYPFKPPVIHINAIFHPNVYPTGRLCISTLEEGKPEGTEGSHLINWRPSLAMANILIGVKNVLEEPNPASPANVDASKMFLRDRNKYEEKNRGLKLKREEGLQRERLKKNQEKEYYEALAKDKKMEAEKTKEKVEVEERLQVFRSVSSDDAISNAKKTSKPDNLTIHKYEWNDTTARAAASGEELHVVQQIQTKSGRDAFKFVLKGVRKPTVGHLREALLSERFDRGQIQLKVVGNQNTRILEDSEDLQMVNSCVIFIEQI